jgi:precorrin-6Y C5,15-methyltransferase (decarboxylating)
VTEPVLIVGVGGDGAAGLPPALLARIAGADELWGGERLLAHWPDFPGKKVLVKGDIADRAAALPMRRERRIVVLASGDPGFYGIASTVLRHVPPVDVEIVPHAGSLQTAFARVGLPWNDAIFTSAHARPLAEVVGWARRAPKLGILTDPRHTPGHIAQTLLDAGLPDCRAVVAEKLGLPDERITDARLRDVAEMAFDPLNVLLLVQDDGWRPAPAFAPRPDDAYDHRRGLITKRDARALILARLALRETDVVWDVGAGSGAVSVEAAELAWRGRVYAVEHDAENLGYIRRNAARHGALNVDVVEGRAPGALADLPAPDAVFVGGTGGALAAIFHHIAGTARPGCRVAASFATLENLGEALACGRELGWGMDVTQVNIAHGADIAGRTRLAPLNPVFIVSTTLAGAEDV